MELLKDDEIKWNIRLNTERQYWKKNLLGEFIPIPKDCPLYKYTSLHASEIESLNNPIIYRCNKCKKAIYIRDHTIYGKFPPTPVSIIHIIIKFWLTDELNTTQIFEKLTKNIGIRISTIQIVRNILTILRQCIAHYFKDKYEIELLATENERKKFAIDESLLTHIDGHQVWLVGIINTQTKDFRLIPVYNRNYTILKNIITKFVEKGNVLISDAWAGYNGFSSADSGYIHIVHNHGHGLFG
jgi:hypothetical protein